MIVSMMRELVPQKNITILNQYIHNNIAPKYIKQKLTELREKIQIPKLASFRVYSLMTVKLSKGPKTER